MLDSRAARTPDDLQLVADLKKHPAWQALERGLEAGIEKKVRILAKKLLTEDYVIDVAEIERERHHLRGQLAVLKSPDGALRKLNQQKED